MLTIEVNGIPLWDGNMDEVVELLNDKMKSESHLNRLISVTDAHCIVYSKKNKAFKKLLLSNFLNLPDGMPSVWVSKLKGAKKIQRCAGRDVFETIIRKTASNGTKHFLCGGEADIAAKLAEVSKSKFKNPNIVGSYSPPFLPVDEFDYKSIADKINRSEADIVWIGLSTPKQQEFAYRLSKYTEVYFLITIGAVFDFHVGKVAQAPYIMQRMGLEWFFRILMEPRRLLRRYLEIIPLFIYYSILDLLKYKFHK